VKRGRKSVQGKPIKSRWGLLKGGYRRRRGDSDAGSKRRKRSSEQPDRYPTLDDRGIKGRAQSNNHVPLT